MGKHGQHGALVGLLLLAASPAVAGCRLALVLALDISASAGAVLVSFRAG